MRPYQGVGVSLPKTRKAISVATLAQALQRCMLQSEQLDTTVVLAANDEVAAGLLIQRMPLKGQDNLARATESASDADDAQGETKTTNASPPWPRA